MTDESTHYNTLLIVLYTRVMSLHVFLHVIAHYQLPDFTYRLELTKGSGHSGTLQIQTAAVYIQPDTQKDIHT